MEINRIDDLAGNNNIELAQLRNADRKCIYDKTTGCGAPKKLLYEMCRTCFRIDAKYIIPNIFKKIVDMASKLFSPEQTGPGQPPAES